ncbi:UBA/THIF-type NAD/FAD binding protein [Russula earlei]|uniref:UBA/THIF-type NAD/FAD binding protein n=1 Tax=Russula earlei TaxID=71964 RepID=A0ACC0TX27_9AGAM|nr:UBA/THIF-type NAD/FAD binding protein [Russula earlei]
MDSKYQRYERQLLLKEIGTAGQDKLLQAKVLVIGAGGLGCPALQYLAAAGIGKIGIADGDTVSLNNLHRQILYATHHIGHNKATTAATVLQQLNTGIEIIAWPQRLTNSNALKIIQAYDLVIDATDNFSTRYMINDACVLLNKPLVYGAISQFEGQVAIFNSTGDGNNRPVNYRDLFPEPPQNNTLLNCAEAGVLGVLPGIIGCMQASEAIKLIIGMGKPLTNCLLTYNALTNQLYQFDLTPHTEAWITAPKDAASFLQMDYDWFCAANASQTFEIDTNRFNSLLHNPSVTIIDVREPGEIPLAEAFEHLHIPLAQLPARASSLTGDILIAFCQSGTRSNKAAQLLFDTFGTTKVIYSLQGGIIHWQQQQ